MVEEYTNLTYDESKEGDAHNAGWDSYALYEVYRTISGLDGSIITGHNNRE